MKIFLILLIITGCAYLNQFSKAADFDIICPETILINQGINCSFKFYNLKFARLMLDFDDSNKWVTNFYQRAGYNLTIPFTFYDRYILFNSEVKNSSSLVGIEILTTYETTVYIMLVNLLCNQNGLNCYKTLKSNQNYQLNRIPTNDYWTELNLTKGYNFIDNATLFKLGFRDQLNKGDLLFIEANQNIKKYQTYSNTEINDFMCTFYTQEINSIINEYYNCSYSPTDFTIAARLILDYDAFSTYSNRTVTFQHNYTSCGTFNLTSNALFFSNAYDPFSINKTRKIDVLCPNENKAIIDILESLNNDPVGCLLNCSNNGVCELTNQKFQCLCKQYFVGLSCDIDTRVCLTSNTCLNNSTCIDYSLNASLNSNEFYCKCENNLFYGTHCEYKIDICAQVTCSNNGNCVDLNGKPFCECYNNFYGEYCENQTASLKMIKSASMIASCIAAISMVLLYLLIIFLDLSKVAKKKLRKRKTFIRFRYVNI